MENILQTPVPRRSYNISLSFQKCWCVLSHLYLSRSLFSYFNYLVSVTAREFPRAQVAKFYSWLRDRLIRSVLRASKFSMLKLIEIVILWVYYTIGPFVFIHVQSFAQFRMGVLFEVITCWMHEIWNEILVWS